MGFRNRYSWTMVTIAIAALLLTALISENGDADDARGVQQAASPYSAPQPANRTATVAAPPSPSPLNRVANLADSHPQPVVHAIATRPAPHSSAGLLEGQWARDTPLGKVELTVSGNKIAVKVEGSGEFAAFNPSLRGEYAIASDGTVFGLIHNVDMGLSAQASQDMGEDVMIFNSLSDIPFSMRTYSEPDVLALKQVTFGLPMQLVMATEGETGELSLYVQSMLTGQYDRSR